MSDETKSKVEEVTGLPLEDAFILMWNHLMTPYLPLHKSEDAPSNPPKETA